MKEYVVKMAIDKLAEYIKSQRFIVKSELSYNWFEMKLNISQSRFLDRTVDCIFDSLEKLADDLDEKKKLMEKNYGEGNKGEYQHPRKQDEFD